MYGRVLDIRSKIDTSLIAYTDDPEMMSVGLNEQTLMENFNETLSQFLE